MRVAPTNEDLTAYLRSTGWKIARQGGRGRLWVASDSSQSVVVPDDLTAESFEWQGIITRVAAAQGLTSDLLERVIAYQYVDLTELRASTDEPSGSILLDLGAALVDSARAIVRSSATSSRLDRLAIDGNYSLVGDRLAAAARMGHTRDGSYILPILMPLPKPRDVDEAQGTLVAASDFSESDHRRVTRTMAQTLIAIRKHIVEPEASPTRAVLGDLLAAGVTRESVLAVERVLSCDSVTMLGAQFEWAAGVRPPGGLPASVEFPSPAAARLVEAAHLMRTVKREPGEQLTGVIVQLRHEPGESHGEFALQTVRKGRPCEVQVRVEGEILIQAFSWFREGDALLVQGRIERSPGRPLRVPAPTRVLPVAETMLFPSTRAY